MEEKRLKQFTFYDLYYEALPGNKKNGANREAKTEQNTVKPKQVKKMQSSPHFVLRKAAQPPFVYESKNTRGKEENFVRNAGNIQRGIYAV